VKLDNCGREIKIVGAAGFKVQVAVTDEWDNGQMATVDVWLTPAQARKIVAQIERAIAVVESKPRIRFNGHPKF